MNCLETMGSLLTSFGMGLVIVGAVIMAFIMGFVAVSLFIDILLGRVQVGDGLNTVRLHGGPSHAKACPNHQGRSAPKRRIP